LLEINRLGLFQLVASDKAFACGQPMPILTLRRDWCVPKPYTSNQRLHTGSSPFALQEAINFLTLSVANPCGEPWVGRLPSVEISAVVRTWLLLGEKTQVAHRIFLARLPS
jgi:hypothetical protein